MNADAPSLYDRPVLVLDPEFHVNEIRTADVDRAGRFVVTGSADKTIRVWALSDGQPERTIRLPSGSDDLGRVHAVALSPDGARIAAGGWLGFSDDSQQEQILIFDRASGLLLDRIGGLPNVVFSLGFSADGQRLAATFYGGWGLRVFSRTESEGWCQLSAVEFLNGAPSYGVAVGTDYIATTCYDGFLRVHDLCGRVVGAVRLPLGKPHGVAINPANGLIAVGYGDQPVVSIVDRRSLQVLSEAQVGPLKNGHLSTVRWSHDGTVVFAAGQYHDHTGVLVSRWSMDGSGEVLERATGSSGVVCICSSPTGALLIAGGDPWLGVIETTGATRWSLTSKNADFRDQWHNFSVSADGSLVDFGLKQHGCGDRFRFNVETLTMLAIDDVLAARPEVKFDGLSLTGWQNLPTPKLGGKSLVLEVGELARCCVVDHDRAQVLLGADWTLRRFDAEGKEIWKRRTPGTVWAVSITGDGRLAVAAYGDGTIRWNRMEDGVELLAFFPMLDGENWVAWTPAGVYAATPGARGVLRWHVNHGWDAAALAVPVSAIPETHRPDVIPHVLPLLDGAEAIKVAELAKIRTAIQRATGSDVPPGARLHVLAIGVSDYGETARHLELSYAHQDALDIAAALRNSQSSIYPGVFVSELVNADATRKAIFRELGAIATAMQDGDVAVIHFSGHGELIDGNFYLLPHGVDASSTAALKDSALRASAFRDEIAAFAKRGRALLFIDACHSGRATQPLDQSLQALLTAPNLAVFTSSAAGELSVEDDAWQNGAFTEALLEALSGADADHDTLIRISDLSRHLSDRVPALTGGRQRPEVVIGYEARILVATS